MGNFIKFGESVQYDERIIINMMVLTITQVTNDFRCRNIYLYVSIFSRDFLCNLNYWRSTVSDFHYKVSITPVLGANS